jgi:hypothetical protein
MDTFYFVVCTDFDVSSCGVGSTPTEAWSNLTANFEDLDSLPENCEWFKGTSISVASIPTYTITELTKL